MISRDSINKLIATLRAKFAKTINNSSAIEAEGSDEFASNSNNIKKRQTIILVVIVLGIAATFVIVNYALNYFSSDAMSHEIATTSSNRKNNIKIEVADETLKSEKLWVNFFEDKLDDTRESLEKKIVTTQESIQKTESKLEKQTVDTITEMTEQLRIAKEELEGAMADIRAFREERDAESQDRRNMLPTLAEVASYEIESHDIYSEVRNSSDYIPEGTYLDGILVTGISVSTSLATRENPTPVTFRVTGSGNLSKDFKVDVRTCKITGSSYGDL